jgi:hypothetical protein
LEQGENPEKNGIFKEGAAQGAAVDTEYQPIEADLQEVVKAWPELPDAVKEDILAMVKSEGGSKTGEKID